MDLPWSQVCRRKSSLLTLQAHPLGQDKRVMGAFLTNWKQSGLKTAPTPLLPPPSTSALLASLGGRKQWDNLQGLERSQISLETQQSLTTRSSQKGPGDGKAHERQQGANNSVFHAGLALLGLAKGTAISSELENGE